MEGLVADSQKRLGLNESHAIPKTSSILSHHDPHDFIATVTRGSEYEGILSSSIGSQERFGDILGGLEAGAIHFAGESNGELSLEHSLRSSSQNISSLTLAITQLQAAVGMLVSCDPFVPCIGMLPRTESLQMDEVNSYKTKLNAISNLLFSTISNVISRGSLLSAYSSTSDTTATKTIAMTNDFIMSLLKLVSLDKLQQRHMDLSLSMSNNILVAFLSGLMEQHRDFFRLHQNQHTLQSLQVYTDQVSMAVQDISNMLEEIVSVVESTYNVRISVFGEIVGSPDLNNQTSSCMRFLAPSLKVTLKLMDVLWKDVKLSKKIAHSFSHLQATKGKDFPRKFKNSSYNASIAIKSLHSRIYNLLASSQHQLLTSEKDGKPITYTQSDNEHKLFIDNLLQYNLKTVRELINGYIVEYDTPTDVKSVDQLSDILNCSSIAPRDHLNNLQLCIKSDFARFAAGALGGLIAASFTNHKLLIPLSSKSYLPQRHAELSRKKLTAVIQDYDLCDSWTVEYAVNLLLLSDQWQRACSFIVELGDWRKAFVLAAITTLHRKTLLVVTGKSIRDISGDQLLNLSHHLAFTNIVKAIGNVYKKPEKSWKEASYGGSKYSAKQIEQFVSETFHKCAMVQMDSVLMSCVGYFLQELVDCSSKFSTRIHLSLYLPAPPLYCIQPAITEEV